jgi:hypothetical protein
MKYILNIEIIKYYSMTERCLNTISIWQHALFWDTEQKQSRTYLKKQGHIDR